MPPIHTPLLKWPKSADDKKGVLITYQTGVFAHFYTHFVSEKIANNIEGYL